MVIDSILDKFLSHPKNLKMGNLKLAHRWNTTTEEIRRARTAARAILGARLTTTPPVSPVDDEVVRKVDLEKGTMQSTATSDYEPKDDIELATLHKIDLTKYKISSYWSKLKGSGKFTSSVFCTLRKIDADPEMQLDMMKEILQRDLSLETRRPSYVHSARKKGRALIIVTADEHVAAANLQDDLYNIPYDKTEYLIRKRAILEAVRDYSALYGEFDDLFSITLGDSLDGWNGGTTRSGEPGHAHVLPQNMNNKHAVEAYIRVNNYFWDELIHINPAISYHKYDVVNSNHGGNGLDYLANLGVEIYLEAKHAQVEVNYIHKLIGHFHYGRHNIMLSHGKDESYRKKPMPLNLDPITELFIKQYMDIHQLDPNAHNVFLKGDLHQWNWNNGKFLDYINVGSLYGSSGWVQANFGLTKPSFAIGVMDSESDDFSLKPIYIPTSLS